MPPEKRGLAYFSRHQIRLGACAGLGACSFAAGPCTLRRGRL